MKKTILIGFLALLLLISSVTAMTLPHPIYGHIEAEGFPVMNAQVQIENLDTGAKGISVTDEKGFYQVDLGNIDERYRDGDNVKVSILYCKAIDTCNKEIQISGGGNQVSWDIEKEHITLPLPDDVVIVKYVCADGTPVDDANNCKPPEQIYVCSDGSKVSSEDECPTNPFKIALGIAIALIGIACAVLAKFKWGKGFVGLANYYVKQAKLAEEREDYAQAEKYVKIAAKMVGTAIRKAKDGFYK